MRRFVQYVGDWLKTIGFLQGAVFLIIVFGGDSVIRNLLQIYTNVSGIWLLVLRLLLFAVFLSVFGWKLERDRKAKGKRASLSVTAAHEVWLNMPTDSHGWAVFVKNNEFKRETTAHNVAALVSFRHIDGEGRKAAGLWMLDSIGGRGPWTERTSIKMGAIPICLPLFYWKDSDSSRRYRPIDGKTMSVNPHGILIDVKDSEPLQYGQWEVLIELVGDNIDEKWALTVTFDPNGVRESTNPAVVIRK